MIVGPKLPPPEIEEVPTTPEERARNVELLERHRRNIEWFNEHAPEFYDRCRGRYICVAGCELFVRADFAAVYAEAIERHPEDRGAAFRWFVPLSTGPKFYAASRILVDPAG